MEFIEAPALRGICRTTYVTVNTGLCKKNSERIRNWRFNARHRRLPKDALGGCAAR